MTPQVTLTSKSRYNGGVGVRRVYGSSTVTEFFVEINGELQNWTVNGYGKTPGERKTAAKKIVLEKLNAQVQGSTTTPVGS